jgi:hypothetical protein
VKEEETMDNTQITEGGPASAAARPMLVGGVFCLHDAGEDQRPESRSVKEHGDCQVRALATARRIPYASAWQLLYEIQGEQRGCAFELVEGLGANDPRLGATRKLSFPAVRGKPRMTPKAFCRVHRTGAFILQLANHVAAVRDGVLFDTWNCSSKCVYAAWEISVAVGTTTEATQVAEEEA